MANRTGFKPGHKKVPGSGRQKGQVNTLTKTVREVVLATFNKLQEDQQANLEAWAKQQPTEFYKIASKLIPTELNAQVETTVKTHDFSKYTSDELKQFLASSETGTQEANQD